MFIFVASFYTAVILTPFVGAILAASLTEKDRWVTPIFFISAVTMVIMIFAGSLFSISFAGISADLIYFFGTYFVVGVCIFLMFRFTPGFIFKPLAALLATPLIVIPLFALSVGGMAVFFAGSDFEIKHRVRSDSGYICRVSSSGNATTSTNWYIVGIYKPLAIFETELEEFHVDQLKNHSATPESLCGTTLLKYG